MMTPDDLLGIAQQSILTLLWATGPIMGVALGVGLIVALFQALTSIQEVTLTFVPKIMLVFLALMFLLPSMASKIAGLASEVFNFIATSG